MPIGPILDSGMDWFRYGILYIVCGIGGNLVSVASDYFKGQYGYSVGASGAVFGVIGALLFMILREAMNRKGAAQGASQARMKSLVIRAGLMTVYLLYSGWSNPVINQAAHVGGMVIGFVLTTVLLPRGDSDLSDLL